MEDWCYFEKNEFPKPNQRCMVWIKPSEKGWPYEHPHRYNVGDWKKDEYVFGLKVSFFDCGDTKIYESEVFAWAPIPKIPKGVKYEN